MQLRDLLLEQVSQCLVPFAADLNGPRTPQVKCTLVHLQVGRAGNEVGLRWCLGQSGRGQEEGG